MNASNSQKKGLSARFVNEKAMRALALNNLGFDVPSGAQLAYPFSGISVYAEALRSALWALSMYGTKPVFVTKLLNAAHKLTEPDVVPRTLTKELEDLVQGEEATDEDMALRRVLEQLETIGDVAVLPGGHWLPSPLRSLHLESTGSWMLIGGEPTALLRQRGIEVEHQEAARFVATDPAPLDTSIGTQTLDDWLRLPHQDLSAWAEWVLRSANMLPFEDRETKFEIYAPGATKLAPEKYELQYSRWRHVWKGLTDGLYLIRIQLSFNMVRHAVGKVERDTVVATGSPQYGRGDGRRLQYGIDLLEHRPTSVEMEREGPATKFVLRNELPDPERRLFTALGRLLPNADGKFYPRKWLVQGAYAHQAQHALEELGVSILTKGI